MSKHETKTCPCCRSSFECKAGSITQCQCNAVVLSAEERAFVESKYEDCLCARCLQSLQKEYLHFREKYVFSNR